MNSSKLSPALERIPPQELDAEKATLGCLLLAGSLGMDEATACLKEVQQEITASDCFQPGNGRILLAIETLMGRGEAPHPAALMGELERRGSLDDCGGRPYIMALAHDPPNPSMVGQFAPRVREASLQRRLAGRFYSLGQQALERGDVGDLLAAAGEIAAWPGMNGLARLPRGITAAALMKKHLSPPKWAVPQVFPAGMTLFAGSMKLGKSWVALQTAMAIAAGGRALGEIPVEPGPVLYVALEDTEWRLQGRLGLLLGESPAPEGLHLHLEWPRLEEGGRAALDAWLSAHPDARLVVIDTLAKFRCIPDPAVNAYYSDTEVSAVIKQLADRHGVSIIAIHHTNKRKVTDIFESISGSNGLGAAADAMMVLQRIRTEQTARLHLTGRDVEDQELGLEWLPHAGWVFRGNAAEFLRTQMEEKVLAVFVMVEGKPLKVKEMALHLEQPENTTRVQLWRMQQKGLLRCVDRLWFPASPKLLERVTNKEENGVMREMPETREIV